MYRALALLVFFFARIVVANDSLTQVLIDFDEENNLQVREVFDTSIDYKDDQLRLIVWADGNHDRWEFFKHSWKRPSLSLTEKSDSYLSVFGRGSANLITTDFNNLQATSSLPQLRSGTITRGKGDLLTPYEGAVLSNPKVNLRRIVDRDTSQLHPATATIFRNGENILEIPFPEKSDRVEWTEIKNLPPSLTDGLPPGRYDLELTPTATGTQRFSFIVAEPSVNQSMFKQINKLRDLLPIESSVPTQIAVEEFLRHRPPMLSDAMDWLESYPRERYTHRLKNLYKHVRQRLNDPNQLANVAKPSDTPTGDPEIDAIRELIVTHSWQAALNDLELIEDDLKPDQHRRKLFIHLYRGVIFGESGVGNDKLARESFTQAIALIPLGGVNAGDQYRIHYNYANFLTGRTTDQLHNHAFQMAAGVQNPLTSLLLDWIEASRQLELASKATNSSKDLITVELSNSHLLLLLADLISTLSNTSEQAKSVEESIRLKSELILAKLINTTSDNLDQEIVAVATEMKAQNDFRRGRIESASQTGERALNLFTQLGDLAGIERSERLLGLITTQTSNDDFKEKALRHFQISERLSEVLRDRYIKDESGRSIAGFMGRRFYVNEQIVDLLASQGKAKQALHHAERAKARAFSDMLIASTGSSPVREDASTEELTKNWPAKVIMLEYFLTSENSWLFVISEEGKVDVVQLRTSDGKPLHPEELIKMVHSARKMLNNYKFQWQDEAFVRRFDDAWQHQLHELFNILLPGEVRQKYLEAEKVVIVPHHILHYFPFAALVTKIDNLSDSSQVALPHFLLDEPFTISYAPSLESWRFLISQQKAKPKSRVGVVADTRPESKLKEVATEVKAIQQAFGNQVLMIYEGQQATKLNALATLTDSDIAFFGCHGQNDWDSPLEGYLSLSDGILTAKSLLNSEINASLVILSACYSGLADKSPLPGDDLFGLERVLMSRGVNCVVSGVWLVDDRRGAKVTSRLIANIAKGKDADLAIKEAMRSVLNHYRSSSDERLRFFSHPHFWGVFKLSGAFRIAQPSI